MSVVLPVAKRGEDILKLIAAPVSANELNSDWLSVGSRYASNNA